MTREDLNAVILGTAGTRAGSVLKGSSKKIKLNRKPDISS
jgi:hypothetical protein